jgi:Flp pilus assembly protein TadD
MRKIGLACFAALLWCFPSPAAPAAESGGLTSPDHWTSAASPELLAELAGGIQHLDPQDSRALARSGHLLLRAGKTEEAAKAFDLAQKSDPKDDEAFVLIAMAYSEKKMWAEADRWFASAVERDPKDVDHKIEWGVSYWNRGDKKKAAELFVKAIQDEPKNGRILDKIGRGIN